jgi:hypothetical protein
MPETHDVSDSEPVTVPDPVDPEPVDPEPGPESGLATAELLGNAALGIAALVAIWAVLQSVGLDVMQWIRAQLLV